MYLGRYTFDLAFEKIIKVAVVAHPFLIKVPDDLEVSSVPFFISSLYAVPLSPAYILFSFLLQSFTFPCHSTNFFRNTPPSPKLPSSSTRALMIHYSHLKHRLKPMRYLEAASLHQDIRGNTLMVARMVLLYVAI